MLRRVLQIATVVLAVTGCGQASDCTAFQNSLRSNFGQPTAVSGNTWLYGDTSCGFKYTFNDNYQSDETPEYESGCYYGYANYVPAGDNSIILLLGYPAVCQ